jgi:hypothetical protein
MTRLPFQTQDEIEAFSVLVLRYLDGGCAAEEVAKLKETIVASAAHRELFVHCCRVQGNLHEVYAPKRAELKQKSAGVPVLRNLPAENLAADPGADTVVRELSAEDTAHPLPKTS